MSSGSAVEKVGITCVCELMVMPCVLLGLGVPSNTLWIKSRAICSAQCGVGVGVSVRVGIIVDVRV